MSELGRTVDVQEPEITVENFIGTTISELDDELPDGILIALVSRTGESQIPEPALQFEHGDHLRSSAATTTSGARSSGVTRKLH